MPGKFNTQEIPFKRETLTVSNAVKVLTASVYNDGTPVGWNQNGAKNRHASSALITMEAGQMRFTTDGTTPVAGAGVAGAGTGTIVNTAGATILLETVGAICNFQAIRDNATDAPITVEYFR